MTQLDSTEKPTRTEALIHSHPEYQKLVSAQPQTASATTATTTTTGRPTLAIEKTDLDFLVNVAQLLVLVLILVRVGQ
ncbi:hypothetical protein [Haladaptatus cibarius]|uniref:hypothetical protein n=1 Tax=Haladaptatus cibarius TaxID=453847 RepID=UPI000679B0CE|nr:hypothetical protein [Haladaptatus cibarius]